MESDYNNLLNQKSNLQNKVETMGSGVSGRIAGIVFISIASVLLTGLFLYLMFKLCQRTYFCYKDNVVFNYQGVFNHQDARQQKELNTAYIDPNITRHKPETRIDNNYINNAGVSIAS